MKILFINSSPNVDGNTAKMTKKFLEGNDYEVLNLVNYKIYSYGQNFDDDQFDEVLEKIKKSDLIVMGSPLYWHNMSGLMRNLIDRFYGHVEENEFKGKDLYFIIQGASPQKWQIDACDFTINRFASLYGFNYKGLKSNLS